MKQLSLISFAIMSIMIFTFSCKKNETVDPLFYSNNTTNTVTSSMQEFYDEEKEESQFFTINANQFQSIVGNKGFQFYLQANSFKDQNNQVVSGNIEIELIEIMKKSEMFRSNKPTNVIGDPNNPNDDAILVSGGEFYINATQNGQELKLDNPIYVRIPTDAPVSNMQVFNGTENSEIGISWTLDQSTTVTVTSDSSNVNEWFYEFPLDSLGWINCDYFYGQAGPFTDINIDISGVLGMNDTNTVVTLVLNNYNAITQCFADQFTYSNNTVDAEYYFNNIPIGTEAILLAVSKINNDYYYDTLNTTISSNIPHIENLQMQAISISQLNTIIDNL